MNINKLHKQDGPTRVMDPKIRVQIQHIAIFVKRIILYQVEIHRKQPIVPKIRQMASS